MRAEAEEGGEDGVGVALGNQNFAGSRQLVSMGLGRFWDLVAYRHERRDDDIGNRAKTSRGSVAYWSSWTTLHWEQAIP
ncbi:hypothetical protein NUU61_004503 [Penicillium alfredii]|uniref:Uncharacterized protein n=1 Tax=Penicillium alfredii TaxID=1506179 RepID=A0A9W9FL92_9EURO|nr:uncharacterized protein NUU61_004503 [Penicillium alfredii]KAJ5102281.1 hypothetical protein NUU61_004503 [Penicillium alfredii]